MKNNWKITSFLVLAVIVLVSGIFLEQEPVYAVTGGVMGGPPLTDAITYQGYLEDGSSAANGYYDFDITIWDLATEGTEIASSQVLDNILVSDGLFSLNLLPNVSMNSIFTGAGRWLQVAVRKHGSTTWTTLPRQPITAAPYAWSLRPGATIEGATSSILNIENTGSGSAISAQSGAPTIPTIAGFHSGDGPGIYGSTSGGYPAVEGIHNGSGIAVGGYSLDGGYGVFGNSSTTSGIGVAGFQSGYSKSDASGFFMPGGFFGGRNGVIAVSKESSGYAVMGKYSGTYGWAGYFASNSNGVYITAASTGVGLTVAGGSKNAAVATDDGSKLLYSEESTEVWFSDYGFGQLDSGVAIIDIDPLFAQTVSLNEPYHVFVQVYGDAEVYVSNRTADSFEVHLREGDSSVEFSYRIVAKRLGFENERLESADWADMDPNLYPDGDVTQNQQIDLQGSQP